MVRQLSDCNVQTGISLLWSTTVDKRVAAYVHSCKSALQSSVSAAAQSRPNSSFAERRHGSQIRHNRKAGNVEIGMNSPDWRSAERVNSGSSGFASNSRQSGPSGRTSDCSIAATDCGHGSAVRKATFAKRSSSPEGEMAGVSISYAVEAKADIGREGFSRRP